MPSVDIVVRSRIDLSARSRQLASMFDCPAEEKQTLRYSFDFPYHSVPWNVGLIVGPSGSGKTTVLTNEFGAPKPMHWSDGATVDSFDKRLSIDEISKACSAVGFNTVPAWMRPFSVLSNGEQFRASLARLILEADGRATVDEFTSVVDRQVAKVASHAVQKYVRKSNKQLVAATCHYDVVDWLQPDWVLDMATQSFQRRRLQRRPSIECTIARVPRSAWKVFAPFHYLTSDIHRASTCFGLWAENNLVAFIAVLFRPHPRTKHVYGGHRVVTLPDWQGLGLGPTLIDTVASAYAGVGRRFRVPPAHPSFVRMFERSNSWRCVKAAGTYASPSRVTRRDGTAVKRDLRGVVGRFGGRPNATFEWVGPAMQRDQASRLIGSA